MLYSVWSWNDQLYHIYKGPGDQPGQRPTPRQVVNDPKGRGRQLEALLPVVPANSAQIGQSERPRGRVAIHHSSPATGLGAYDDPQKSPLVHSPWTTLGIGALGVLISYRLLVMIAKRF